MAVAFTRDSNAGVHTALYTGVTTANATAQTAFVPAFHGSITAVVSGTFGSATVGMSGSNDGTNFSAVTDKFGNAWTVTAAGNESLLTGFKYYKPTVTGGTSDSLAISVVAMR
jgi:hypothetical protein